MKTEAPHSQASAEKHTPGPIEQLLRDQEKEINRLRDVQKELLEALKRIAAIGGNLPDDHLMGRTGPNDAAQRGIMYVNARLIANHAIAKAEKQP